MAIPVPYIATVAGFIFFVHAAFFTAHYREGLKDLDEPFILPPTQVFMEIAAGMFFTIWAAVNLPGESFIPIQLSEDVNRVVQTPVPVNLRVSPSDFHGPGVMAVRFHRFLVSSPLPPLYFPPLPKPSLPSTPFSSAEGSTIQIMCSPAGIELFLGRRMNVGVAARPSPPDTMHPSDHYAPSHPFADPSVCLATRLSPPDCFSASLGSSPSRCGSEALKAAACRPAGGLRERPSLLGPQGLEQEWAAIFGDEDGEDGDNGGYGDDVDYGYSGNDGKTGGEREEEDDEEDVPWEKAFPSRSPRSNLSAQALRTSSLSPDSPSISPRSSSAALAAALAASRKADSFREDLDSSDEEFLAAYCHITGSPTAESPVSSPPSAASAGSAFRGPVVRALQKSASCLEGRGEQRQAPVRAQAARAQALAKSQETLLRKGGASSGASGARDAHARVRAQEAADVPQRSFTAPSGGGKPAAFAAPFAAVIAHQNLEQQKLHLKKQLQQAQQLRTAIGGGFGGGSGGGGSGVSSSGSSCSGLNGSDLARGLGHESGGKQAGSAAAAAAHGARAAGGNGGGSSAGSQAQQPSAAQARSRGKGGHADTPAGGVVSAGARKLFGFGSQSHRMLPHAATTGGGPRSLVRGRSWASLEFQRAQDPPQSAPHLEELVPCTKGLPTIESSGSGSGSGSGNGGGSSRSREKGSGGSRTVSFSERHSALLSPADSPRARAGAAALPLSAMGRASSAAAGGASRGSPSFPHERSALPELPGLAKRALLAQAHEGTGASGAGGALADAGAPGLSRTSSARQLYVQKMLLDLAAQSDEASEAGSGSGSGHASPCVASGGGSGTGGSGKGGRSGLSKRGVLGRSVSGKEHAGRRAGATAQEAAEAAQSQLGAVRRSASARYQPASRLSVDFSATGAYGGGAAGEAAGGMMGGSGGGGSAEGRSLGRSASDKAMQGGDQARMVGLPSISGAISGAAATVRGKVSTVLVDPFAGAYNGEACDEDEDDEDLFDILAAMRSMQTSPQSPNPISPFHPCPPRSPVPLSPSPANSPHGPPHHTYSRDPSPAPRAPRPSSPPPPPLLRSPSPASRSPSPRSRTASQPNHPSSFSLSHSNITPARPASQLYSSAPGPAFESPPRSPPLSPLGSSSASSPRSPPLTPPRNNRRRSLHIPSRSMPSALARPNRRHSVSEDRQLNMTHPAARQPGSGSGGAGGGSGGGPFAAASSHGASAAATRAFAMSRSLNSSSSAAAAAAAAVKAAACARRGQAGIGEGKLGGGGVGSGRHLRGGSSGSGNCNGSGGGDVGDRVFGRARTQPTERESAGRG
ncbi:unnamed protein product [Closterium sp. Naga37s-1]|nr:unnamed protein product [Closterium sp. Naga37s-1]